MSELMFSSSLSPLDYAGFETASTAFLTYAMPTLGPTATVLLFNLSTACLQAPICYFDSDELAQSMGVLPSQLTRSLGRLRAFQMVDEHPLIDRYFYVATRVEVKEKWVAALPKYLRPHHERNLPCPKK